MTRDQIEAVKEIINYMAPWDIMKRYLYKASLYDNEAFSRIVECGTFWLEMKRGELHWQFFMPSTYIVLSASPHNFSISWDCGKYIKEVDFRKIDLENIEMFFASLEKEMSKEMFSQFSKEFIEGDE